MSILYYGDRDVRLMVKSDAKESEESHRWEHLTRTSSGAVLLF